MRKRVAGPKAAHSYPNDVLPYFLFTASPNLGTEKGDVDELLTALRTMFGADEASVLVIIDTLVRTLHGAEENGDGLMNFANNAELVADQLKCLVIAVHHQGSGEGMRGHTSLPGASVASLHVEAITNGSGRQCRITVEVSKDGESGIVLVVTLLGDPECAATLVVESIEPGASDDTASKGSKEKRPRVSRVSWSRS